MIGRTCVCSTHCGAGKLMTREAAMHQARAATDLWKDDLIDHNVVCVDLKSS